MAYSTYQTLRKYPQLRSYQEAADHEFDTKPMNKSSRRYAGTKPLGPRKQPWMQIKRAGEDILIQRMGETMAVYRPNGEIVIHPQADYEKDIVSHVTGIALSKHDGRTWVRAMAPGADGGDVWGVWPLRTEGEEWSVFRRDSDGVMRYVNPLYPTKYVINRKAMNAARAKHADFRTYAHGMIKLMGEGTPMATEFRKYETYPYMHDGDLIAGICGDDAGQWANAVVHMVRTVEGNRRRWPYKVDWSTESFEKAFTELLLHAHGSDVLDKVEVRTGKVVDDPHRYYAKGSI